MSTSVLRGRDQETYREIALSGSADRSLTATEAIGKVLVFTGAPDADMDVFLPIQPEEAGLAWTVRNAVSGGFSVTLRAPSGDGVECLAGDTCEVFWDGTHMRPAGGSSGSLIVSAASGNEALVLSLTHQYVNADFPVSSGNHPDYSILELNHTNLADTGNVASPTDLIWTGLRSRIVYGSDTVNARGTEHTATVTIDVQGSDDPDNEVAAYMGWVRAKAASGTPADGVASMWFTDFSLHGNIGAQSALLNGITMFVNSYHADSPVNGRSSGLWIVTKPGQGAGREDGHDVAETHTLDFLAAIAGWAGTPDGVTRRRGAETAFGIGEWGSRWFVVGDDGDSWFGHALSLRGGELAGLLLRDPHYDPSNQPVGSAILMDTADAGLSWLWHFDIGAANAPIQGAIRLHDANSATAGRIQWGSSVHGPALYRSADGTLTLRLPDASAGAKFHVHRTVLSDPAHEVGGADAVNVSLSSMVRNDGGQISLCVVGANDNFFLGSVPGDVAIRWDADQVLGFAGSTTLVGSISGAGAWKIAPAAGTVGFFAGAGAAKQAVTGSRGGNAALASLLSALAAYGFVTDSTSA